MGRFRSVRARVTLLATVVLALAGVVAAIGLIVGVRGALTAGIADSAELRADDLAQVLDQDDLPDRLGGESDGAVVQVVGPSGEVLVASENVDGEPAITDARPPAGGDEVATISGVPTDPGQDFLVVSRSASLEGDDVVIHVAASLEPVDRSLKVLIVGLLAAGPALLAVAAAVVWRVIGRALGPVEAIRAEVDDISIADLAKRVPVPDSGDEIARLATTMNAMLERMEHAVGRQRRFVADASHELRSPVTAMAADLEVAIRHPRPAEAEAILPELLAETRRLQRIIDSLLLLARWDEQPIDHRAIPVDLDDLVLDEASRVALGTSVVIDTTAVSAGQVWGDGELLRRAVRNLLENAVRHGRTRVSVRLVEQKATVTLEVDDDGPGIAAEERERIFERFTRLDTSRARASGGSGLGLAIVAEIVSRHDGAIEVSQAALGGARFTLTLPASTAEDLQP